VLVADSNWPTVVFDPERPLTDGNFEAAISARELRIRVSVGFPSWRRLSSKLIERLIQFDDLR